MSNFSPTKTRPLTRVSSLVLHASPQVGGPHGRKETRDMEEEIPDSEEERLGLSTQVYHPTFKAAIVPLTCKGRAEPPNSKQIEVIVISSDEEELCNAPLHPRRVSLTANDPFMEDMPEEWCSHKDSDSDSDDESDEQPPPAKRRVMRGNKGLTPRSRRVIYTSSDEDEEDDVDDFIRKTVDELSDSSPGRPSKSSTRQEIESTDMYGPYEIEDEPWNINDGSVLVLNDPKSSRKPLPLKNATKTSSTGTPRTPSNWNPTRRLDSHTDEIHLAADPSPLPTPSVPRVASPSTSRPTTRTAAPPLLQSKSDSLARPHVSHSIIDSDSDTSSPASHTRTRTRTSASPTKPKKLSKKAQQAAEQLNRVTFSRELFTELNRVVFGNRLAQDTKLTWNVRLLSTAGRATWHRSKDGVQTSEIELATKILDSDERIAHTLSHEMCHLASWVISGEPSEGHGQIWKSWAARIEKKRPDIEITTRHNYEINYPYEWECEKCAQIYGRFSKSIRPDECVCGKCKEGKLVPLFPTTTRTPKTKADSRLAAVKGRDSPRSIPRGTHGTDIDGPKASPTPYKRRPKSTTLVVDDSDVEQLTKTMGVIEISD